MTGKRLMIDTSKCIGCRACQVSCQQWHSLTAEDTTFTGEYTNPPELSGTNLTLIKFIETEEADKVNFHFVTDRCRHCDLPNCKPSCPLKAIKRQANGIVRIDPNICNPMACTTPPNQPVEVLRPCQLGCPFKVSGDGIGIPRRLYKKNGVLVAEKSRKCDFCYNRFGTKGANLGIPLASRKPACEVTCAPGAIKSGAANGMLKKANARVTYLKANGYPNANVYPSQTGLETHVIWVLLESPGVFGMPIL